MQPVTVGVEEEFHLVDAETGRLRPDARRVVERARERLGEDVDPELLQSQVETGTAVCTSLDELRGELVRLRRDLADTATSVGCRIAASGTYPGSFEGPPVTENARYQRMRDVFGVIAREQVVCGCHVHVGVSGRDLAAAVVRRSRPWLPTLLALSANSPFWQAADTGYAAYRTQVWSRWPTAGPPPAAGSAEDYDAAVDALLATGVLRDRGMLYWQARLSHKYDSVEFRPADVCLSVDDAVLVAGLTRALAVTCVQAEEAGEPVDDPTQEVLRAAQWQASRYGLTHALLHPADWRPAPAADVVTALLEHVRPALEEHGDVDEVTALLERTQARGTGADRQRAAYARAGRMEDVLALLAEETAAGR